MSVPWTSDNCIPGPICSKKHDVVWRVSPGKVGWEQVRSITGQGNEKMVVLCGLSVYPPGWRLVVTWKLAHWSTTMLCLGV